MNERLSEIPKSSQKKKSEGSKIQFELDEKLTKVNLDLIASLGRNSKLERDMVWIKAKLEKALK